MNKTIIALGILCLFCSCLPERTEIWVSEDNLIETELSFDLQDRIDDNKVLLEMFKTQIPDSQIPNDIPEGGQFTIVDFIPDSVLNTQQSEKDKQAITILQSVKFGLRNEAEHANSFLVVNQERTLDFNKVKSFMDKNDSPDDPIGFNIVNELMNPSLVEPEFNVIRLPKKASLIAEIGTTLDSLFLEGNQGMIDLFLKMSGLSGDHQYIVHAPGKVLFTNFPNAKIDENIVVIKQAKSSFLRSSAKDLLIKYIPQ